MEGEGHISTYPKCLQPFHGKVFAPHIEGEDGAILILGEAASAERTDVVSLAVGRPASSKACRSRSVAYGLATVRAAEAKADTVG
ncbi:hypothetical protein [Moorena sp. SIO3A2]|uniref:hypothetical protein n=1 Tax=Moorena sp. SIO3A2 TaxID=2607841 RepID=UPI0013B61D04|nr:hypothetical protein [Moorena sp. SIO3A2]NER92225.1 hypothetical protein [Moorena sp. SIO3A2]